MTLNTATKTVQDVGNAVKRQFGDESGVQISDSDIIRWVNEGQQEISFKNKILKGKADVSSVAGQADYTMPSVNIAAVESLHYNGYPIPGVPYPEVENYIKNLPDSSTGSGDPQFWYEWAGTLTLFPAPSSVGTITLLYTSMPTEVTSTTDSLVLPDKYFKRLVEFCLVQAHEMDEDFDAATYKSEQFTNGLDTMADEERSTSQLTYPVINDVVDY